MAKYIERGKFLKECIKTFGNMGITIKAIEGIANECTADVVEVVRCKDCKYQDDCVGQMVHTTRDYVLEQNISTYNRVDFCSYGERKDQQ